MFATISTLIFLAAALLAIAVIAASLAKGVAAASMLRRQLALCGDVRTVTVRHERARGRPVATVRPSRRPLRPAPVPTTSIRQLVAA